MLLSRPKSGRSLATGLAGLALAATVAGCGTVHKVQDAAVVNGSRVTTEDLATATSQYNAAFVTPQGGKEATEQQVLPFLINAKVILPWAQRSGAWKPDTGFATALARVSDPAPVTRELLEAVTVANLYQQGQLPQAASASLEADFKAAKVQVAPRYGTFDPASPFALTALAPNWIKPGSSATSTTAATPQQ